MKKILSSLLFILITVCLIFLLGEVVLPKDRNAVMQHELDKLSDTNDVLVFGSCHAYTSFNPILLWNNAGITSYNLARPSENIISNFLFMKQVLKTQKPKVVLIETWGTKIYDTYIEKENVLGNYFISLIDHLPYSKEREQVIDEYDSFGHIYDNVFLTRYKDRIVNAELTQGDFDYNYVLEHLEETEIEQHYRNKNLGFKANTHITTEVDSYFFRNKEDNPEESKAIEADLEEYLDKIIKLCQENGIRMIFYRSPYLSNKKELKQDNYLESYFNEKGLEYYDLEKEIPFDYSEDLLDNHHLNASGGKKATSFLIDRITEITTFKDKRENKKYEDWNSKENVFYDHLY